MTEFETALMCLLIPVGYVFAYVAGRINLFELLLETAEERLNELREKNDEFKRRK